MVGRERTCCPLVAFSPVPRQRMPADRLERGSQDGDGGWGEQVVAAASQAGVQESVSAYKVL